MANIDLTKYGITGTTEIVYNPSYEELFKAETDPSLTGYDKGQVSELGAVNVMTGIYTGRSPKDKFIVMDENSKDTVWWTSDEFKNDNKPASQEAWDACKALAVKELSNKKLYVMDVFCGTNPDSRMAVRFIMEVAWQAHFVKNMFIQPTEEELKNFKPDFVSYNAAKAKVENYKELGLNSETAAIFNITSREQVILNTWYGGEMKKGMFSMMNYYLPLKGIASMHCSANTDMNGENTAIFFGLSGTGGWSNGDGLIHCVKRHYDLESESFRVSLLKHEAQHASDQSRYPGMSSADLEYRAKLVELIYSEERQLLGRFLQEADAANPGNAHGLAAERIVRGFARRQDGDGLAALPIETVRAAALELFRESSREMAEKYR